MPKQPEDKKQSAEPFVWTAEDGRTITFKAFTKLRIGLLRQARNLDSMNATFMLLEGGTDDKGLAVLDDQELGTLDDIFEAWTADAEVESPGES